MKIHILLIVLLIFSCSPILTPVNVGREYGNPTMPLMVSHLPEKNQAMLRRRDTPHHTVFTRILCFKKICRMKVGRTKALHPISYDKFKKKIAKNAKKGEYKSNRKDSLVKPVKKPIINKDTARVITPVISPVTADPVLKADSLITLSDVLFEINSATLKSEHFPDLASVIDLLIAHPSLMIKVSGHTDNTGSEARNKALSYKRAEVVAEYLIDNGIGVERVSFEGLGSSKPIAPNNTSAGRGKNRRVELLIHDGRNK